MLFISFSSFGLFLYFYSQYFFCLSCGTFPPLFTLLLALFCVFVSSIFNVISLIFLSNLFIWQRFFLFVLLSPTCIVLSFSQWKKVGKWGFFGVELWNLRRKRTFKWNECGKKRGTGSFVWLWVKRNGIGISSKIAQNIVTGREMQRKLIF